MNLVGLDISSEERAATVYTKAPPLHYYTASSSTIIGIFQKTKVLPKNPMLQTCRDARPCVSTNQCLTVASTSSARVCILKNEHKKQEVDG
ncbi:MAG: hypothetical protein NUV76_10385, partial [Candidatus Kuenenia sp.]|nr:hypothetical protein [Candidatus Kuenenia sp.]